MVLTKAAEGQLNERRTNECILGELGRNRRLISIINQRKLRYIGHAVRNKTTDLMKTVLQGKTQSRRKKGRPATSYISALSKTLGIGLQTTSQYTQSREQWRTLTRSACVAPTIGTDDGDR